MEKSSAAVESGNIDLVANVIGEFGLYQLLIAIFITFTRISNSMHKAAVIYFTTPLQMSCNQNQTQLTFDGKNPFISEELCSLKNCTVIFDRTVFQSTIVSDWNLLCDRYYLAEFSHTIHMIGNLVGNIIFGYVADKYGRYLSLITSSIIVTIFGTATAFTTNINIFLINRLLCGFGVAALLVGYTLLLESIGTKYRFFISLLYQLGYAIGMLLLTLSAYYIRNWKSWYISFSAPFAGITILYVIFLRESPRWLLLHGKPNECVRVLERAAKFNRLSTEHISQTVNDYHKLKELDIYDHKKSKYRELFQKSFLAETITLCFVYLTYSIASYTNFNFRRPSSEAIFTYQLFLALALAPGVFFSIGLRQFMSIRKMSIATTFACALSLGIRYFVSHSKSQLVLAIIFCFLQTVLQSSLMILVTEIYPTELRSRAQGLTQASSNIGSMLGPFPLRLEIYHQNAPILLYFIAFVVGTITLTLFIKDGDGHLRDRVNEDRG